MLESILAVCLGNICRSPMAEGLLKSRVADANRDIHIASAGLAAPVGYPADPVAVELMRSRDIDITGHRARQLTPEVMRRFDVVLVMEYEHQRRIERSIPVARGRVFTLGRWDNMEIPDPVGRSREHFELALALIEQGIDSWMRFMGNRA